MSYVLTFVFVGALAFLVAVGMFVVFLRREQAIGAVSKRDDLASMMMLLQTMRDLLEQQKGFARELNKALDARVEVIKQTVGAAKAELQSVSEAVKQLRAEVEQRKRDMEANPAPRSTPSSARQSQPANVRQLSAYTSAPSAETSAKEHERPALRVLAMPREIETTGDAIDSWVGLDFAGDEPEPLGFDVPETEPEAPHDADAARSAFRALLDMSPEEPVEKNSVTPVPPPTLTQGNGRPVPPVHARVYEYNDAGMNVAQIAQELGIGKGEVRLILSLRKSKDG